MALTIAGIPLPLDASLESYAYSAMDPEDAWPLEPPTWPSPPSHLGRFQFASRWVPTRRLRFNQIAWPMWGMGRWAYGVFLVHATQAEEIRKKSINADGVATAVELVMEPESLSAASAGNADRARFMVYPLPPRVVSRVEPADDTTSDGLYALPVVDRRYFLNDPFISADFAPHETCDWTWDDAYEWAMDNSGLTTDDFAWDPVAGDAGGSPTGYHVAKPHPDLFHRFATHGTLFDAIAASVGQRILALPHSSWPMPRSVFDGDTSPHRFHAINWQRSLAIRHARDVSFADRGGGVKTHRSAGGKLHQKVL